MGKGLIQSPSSSNDNWGQTPVISSLSPDQCPYSCSPSFMNLRWLQLLFARNDPEVLPVSCCAQVPWSPLAWKPQDTWTLLLLAQHSWCSRRRNTNLLFCCPLFLMDPSEAERYSLHFWYVVESGISRMAKILLQRQQIPRLFLLQWVQHLHTNQAVTEKLLWAEIQYIFYPVIKSLFQSQTSLVWRLGLPSVCLTSYLGH